MSDSDTGSESEREVLVDQLKHLTKEEIYHYIKKSGCTMLSGRRLLHLKKDVLIEYLTRRRCPAFERLVNESQKQKD
jgi:hypothetical protein